MQNVPSTFGCPRYAAEVPPMGLWWLFRRRARDYCAVRTVVLGVTQAESHWRAPSKGLHGAQDMVEHPAGRRSSLRRPIPQERGDLNRLRRDAAQLYALRAQEAQAAAEKVERLEAYRRDHAEQLRLFEAAQPVATPEQLGLPPLTSPKPTTPDERTAAVKAYVMA